MFKSKLLLLEMTIKNLKIAFDNGSNIKLSGIQKNIGKQKWIDNGILELLDV